MLILNERGINMAFDHLVCHIYKLAIDLNIFKKHFRIDFYYKDKRLLYSF